ncbi:cytochrome c oxidase subunit 3 [Ruegeria pomeroyi]|jgi:cytochrome c oxidase subunit 3|uniref:cytochrome-c oxidase n=2 Tax=Ruegeria pomeroyi TaxID=89184 RepID=Q5LNY0_RUEPO|nr:cytochrome c oxidase subunit 3 [Ruegeria pomeroyi]HCE72631.1 cytochrome c oxidase subunit 3 [Ruegeria sp.]AAV96308.1 cytochrome c oxidase, subunit III [Ruegeria pomeroyi DSS-3]NVK96660.1 cytochrome c oxidase subunit 3 [Ruegeria pomeroyi]NVL02074.1 cytochrome c oxidase subunit 3 [Ruegeria pomeroyi]QWV09856.1 cytochrome c oxidase subunit 3 [Ruegeria pomeroyi]
MAHAKNHDYHILAPSIWPLIGSIGGFVMLFGAVLWMHGITPYMFWAGFIAVLYVMYAWWAEVVAESRVGDHTPVVRIGLRYGMILFITSEVMFFFAWFWSFFKHRMYPMQEYVGTEYVAPSIHAVDPFHLPLINTLVLLLSGCAVTWAHHALVHNNDRKALIQGLSIGIFLGMIFTLLQAYEYAELLLHEDWTFGGDQFYSNFFMATGFHGMHVIIGTIFLAVCLLRALKGDFTPEKHIGFEAAAWYWHFVDVVWLFLFFAVYIWGQWPLL